MTTRCLKPSMERLNALQSAQTASVRVSCSQPPDPAMLDRRCGWPHGRRRLFKGNSVGTYFGLNRKLRIFCRLLQDLGAKSRLFKQARNDLNPAESGR